MFNKFNVNNNIDIKAELLKNRRESIADISDYINKISYKLNSYSTIDISVSKYVMNKNVKRENKLYNIIKNNMQVILYVNNKKERYILSDTTKKSSKNSGTQTFTAYSFEKTLENKNITFSSTGGSYPLVNDGIEDGILEMVSRISGWKIGYVDELAKSEYIYAPITKTIQSQKDLICLNVQPEQLLWESDVNITTDIEDIPINITLEHKGMSRYDSYGDLLMEEETLRTVLNPVHADVVNIKTYYYSVAGNRYGIKVLLTLKDGAIVTQTKEFTNLKNLKMHCKKVNIIYETGHIEQQYVTKYAWLENVDCNIYNFLSDMQEEFNVVFVFDTYNNIINCYSKDSLNDESPLALSFDSNVIDINVKHTETPISGVKVTGKDDVSIININKYGSDIIYNYNYFIYNKLLSDELFQALHEYENYLNFKQLEWNSLSEKRRLLYENKVKLDCEIKSLTDRITTLAELLSAFIVGNASSSEQERIKREKIEFEKVFNENIKLRNEINDSIATIDERMGTITNSIKRENSGLFTDEDLAELNDIDIVESYSNDVATTSDSLYNSASWYLNEKTKPTIEFSIKCTNLIKLINNPLGWDNILQLTKLIYLDSDVAKEIGEDKVRLVGMDIDVKNKSVDNLSFTNKMFPVDLLKMAKKMQKKAIATILNNNAYKSVLKDSENINEIVNNIKNNGINISNTPIKTSETYNVSTSEKMARSVSQMSLHEECDNDVEQSRAGIFIKSKSNPDKQLYIGSGLFAISSDGFETSEVAIDDNGITAKLLKGKILLGEKLYITSDDGNETFYIGNMETSDGFGLRISDTDTGEERVFLGTELDENGKRQARLRLNSKNGSTAISEQGLISVYSYVYNDDLDNLHPIEFNHLVDTGTVEIRECKLSLFLQRYRTTVKSLSSGGQITTTSSNGTQISTTSDCEEISTLTETSGYYSEMIDSFENIDNELIGKTSDVLLYEETEENVGKIHYHEYENIKHKHQTIITIPEHFHKARLVKHSHTFSIDGHSHAIDTTHNHDLQAGIFESTLPSNCSVYVNDVLVMSNINYDTVIEIGNYLRLGESNRVKITSDTLGRVQLSMFYKSFIEF